MDSGRGTTCAAAASYCSVGYWGACGEVLTGRLVLGAVQFVVSLFLTCPFPLFIAWRSIWLLAVSGGQIMYRFLVLVYCIFVLVSLIEPENHTITFL